MVATMVYFKRKKAETEMKTKIHIKKVREPLLLLFFVSSGIHRVKGNRPPPTTPLPQRNPEWKSKSGVQNRARLNNQFLFKINARPYAPR
jgi:hypothetical protein